MFLCKNLLFLIIFVHFFFLSQSIYTQVPLSSVLEDSSSVKIDKNSDLNISKIIRVLLHAGHGGRKISPNKVYGDKWSPVKQHYLTPYYEGAIHENSKENEITYKIVKSVQKIFQNLSNINGKRKFENLLREFNHNKLLEENIIIDIQLARETDFYTSYFQHQEDPNAIYRLYDYPDSKKKEVKAGILSKINKLKPHLIISVHLDTLNTPGFGSMYSIITPGYSTYKLGKKYLLEKNIKKRNQYYIQFQKSGYTNWFMNDTARTPFSSFLLDVCSYFTGNWCDYPPLSLKNTKYLGYRYNMLQWRYADLGDWKKLAKEGVANTPYSGNIKTFLEKDSLFWKRERSKEEEYRRENGFEGIGGDNLYASQELLRYIRTHFYLSGAEPNKKKIPKLDKPITSTWSLPTYTNAIHAFLELGSVKNIHDKKRFDLSYQLYSEAIAIGIYSLIYSMKPIKIDLDASPKGKKINFSKYGTYFQDVVK